MEKVLQIMPADGWGAVYQDKLDNPICSPLVCWALVEDEHGSRSVRGLDADCPVNPVAGYDSVGFADTSSNFMGYKKGEPQ